MIISSLVDYYKYLVNLGVLPEIGWAKAKISFLINLDKEGKVIGVTDVREEVSRGKKKNLVAAFFDMPEAETRSNGVKARFLWDNIKYCCSLGDDKPERLKECYKAMGALNSEVLHGVSSPGAVALKKYFEAEGHEEVLKFAEKGGFAKDILTFNLSFSLEGNIISEDEAVIEAWNRYYSASTENAEVRFCSVLGKDLPIAEKHPNFKSVAGAQSSGSYLVSFNADAFSHYGFNRGMNCSVSSYAASAYGSCLAYLFNSTRNKLTVGDMTLLMWAYDDSVVDFMRCLVSGSLDDAGLKISDIRFALDSGSTIRFGDEAVDLSTRFCFLGIMPNAARLSIELSFDGEAREVVKNILEFYADFDICHPKRDTREVVPLWRILGETCNKKAKTKVPLKELTGACLESMLFGTPYPVSLMRLMVLRLMTEKDDKDKGMYQVTREKVAAMKAVLRRNFKERCAMTNLTDVPDVGYVLGRIMAVAEHLQKKAQNGEPNVTIKDRFFNSLISRPEIFLPKLIKMINAYLAQLRRRGEPKRGDYVFFSKLLDTLLGSMTEVPGFLDNSEKVKFVLGYQHQKQDLFKSKLGEE